MALGSPQLRLRHERFGVLVAGSNLLEDPYRGLQMTGGGARLRRPQRLAQQPMGDSLKVAVSEIAARGEDRLENRARPLPFALEQVAVPQPDAERGASQVEVRLLEPRDRLRQLRGPSLNLAQPDQSVPLGRLRHGGVDGARREIEGFLTAADPSLRISPMDVRPSCPPPAHHLDSPIVHRLPVLESPAAVAEAPLPLAQVDEGDAEPPQRPAGPPHVALPLERVERALAGLDRGPKVARHRVDVREAALGEGFDLVQAGRFRDRQCLTAIGDGGLRARAGDTVEEARPVVPPRAAGRVGRRIDQRPDLLERSHLLRMPTERKLDLRLLDDSVDSTEAVRLRVGHRLETLERILERGEGFGVCPAPLRLGGGEESVIDGFLGLRAPPEVVREKLHHVIDPPGVELLEAAPGGRVVLASAALQHARIHHVLGQRVLEAVHQLGFLCARKDEVEAMELPEMPGDSIRDDLEDAREQGHSKASPHDCRPLERVLERFREAVNAGRDDVVDGRRDRHVGAPEPRLAVLDEDPARLLKLAEDLLHVKGIPRAPLSEDLEELLGDVLGGEQGSDHAPDVASPEAFEGDRLRQRRGEPWRRIARPRRQHQQDALTGQASRQMREEFLGGRIDPVEIFDNQDEGGCLART